MDIEKLISLGEDLDSVGVDPALIFNEARITKDMKFKINPAVSVGYYMYKGNKLPIPYGSYGDFSCIVGPSKSMKTYFLTALIAGYVGKNSKAHFPNIIGHKQSGKMILHVDTEQSKYHSKRVMDNAFDMIGERVDNYAFWQLRGYSALERHQFIEYLAFESEYKNDIGLFAIDGAADLIENTNDLVESRRVVDRFMSITDKTGCHLMTVLHRNFDTQKPTGHIGSAILKRAETVAFVTRDEHNEITVSCEYGRNKEFDDFRFKLDKNYLPTDTEVLEDDFFADDE